MRQWTIPPLALVGDSLFQGTSRHQAGARCSYKSPTGRSCCDGGTSSAIALVMAQEGIFRFVSLRAASGSPGPGGRVLLYAPGQESPFAGKIAGAFAQPGGARRARELAEELQRQSDYVGRIEAVESARALLAWLEREARTPIAELEAPAAGSEIDRRRIADSLLADSIRPTGTAAATEQKATVLKLYDIVETLRNTQAAERPGRTLAEIVKRISLVIPKALCIRRAPAERLPVPVPTTSDHPKPLPAPTPTAADVAHTHRQLRNAARHVEKIAGPSEDITTEMLRLSARGLQMLDDRSRSTLGAVSIDLTDGEPAEALRRLEGELAQRSGNNAVGARPGSMLMLGGMAIDLRRARDAFRVPIAGGVPIALTGATCMQRVGVGDLLIVKKRLKGYEVTDFAHVENVLAGETRERDHRRLSRREETTSEATETVTEKERDLQTSDRSELQNEVERTIQTETTAEAGFQLSGSYGPSVTFSTNVGASFSVSTEESARRASTFAREVVEKTAERIREQVKRERVTRILEETEEINRHRLSAGQSGGHLRGVYRWLNKIYDVEVLRYGQRMMFEFVVPEPAAYLLYAMFENPPPNLVFERPDPPTFEGEPLRPIHLDAATYQDYVATYQPVGVSPPPSAIVTVSAHKAIDGADQKNVVIVGLSDKIVIPPGREATHARLNIEYTRKSGESYSARVRIGSHGFQRTGNVTGHTQLFTFSSPLRGDVAWTVVLDDVFNYAISIDVECTLTDEGLAQWQHQTFDAIMEAYQKKKSEYDEAQRAKEIQTGVPALGQNPAENRRVERTELRKLVIQFLTGGSSLGRGAFLPDSDEPVVDVVAACPLGKYIQFIENAFEWGNMQYVFYPYFWGRRARWATAIHLRDPDPDFAAFLAAGAARVQVPVRPGFEKAVAYFVQFGEIYEGEDPALLDDELYVPIVNEIAENLGREAAGVPYPEGAEPFESRVPTALVLVQDLHEIPPIADVLRAEPVSLLGGAE